MYNAVYWTYQVSERVPHSRTWQWVPLTQEFSALSFTKVQMVCTLWTSLLSSSHVRFCLNLYQCFRIGLWISNSNWFTNCCWKSEQRVGKKYFLTQRHNPGSSSQISLSRADKSKWEPDKSIVTEISTFCRAAGAQFGFCSKIHESRSKRVPMTGALIMQPSFNYQHCTS